MSEKEYKDKCEMMFKKNAILINENEQLKWENKEILEDNENYQNENEQLKQQIEKITSILWWESHTDDDKLRNIWKVLLPGDKYMRD